MYAQVYRYTIASDSWVTLTHYSASLAENAAAYDPAAKRIFLTKGPGVYLRGPQPSQAAVAYDTVTGRFERLPPQPSISGENGGAFLDGRFYVTQGFGADSPDDGFWAFTPGG